LAQDDSQEQWSNPEKVMLRLTWRMDINEEEEEEEVAIV
jgi:hypothetical protein